MFDPPESPKPIVPPVYKLVNNISDIMEEAGVTLEDLLEDLPKIREEIHRERLNGTYTPHPIVGDTNEFIAELFNEKYE